MGIISLEKQDHLYWLGRYSERVYTTLKTFLLGYDQMLDDVGTIPLFWTVQGTLTSDRVKGLKLLSDNSTRSRYAVLVK